MNNSVIITPNRRLSATLYQLYQQYQIDLQKTYWQTPDILPILTWIQRFFTEFTHHHFDPHPLLLNSIQEQVVWENILNEQENDFLLQLSETAELSKAAFSLLKQWQVPMDHPIFDRGEDYKIFKNWALAFQQVCHKNNWIDSNTLPDIVTSHIKEGAIKSQAQIFLIGFIDLSPQIKSLLNALAVCGSEINQVEIFCKQINANKIRLIDEETEILTMARWAKALSIKHPMAKIGCVIPSLNNKRDRIKQIFSECFAKENAYATDQEECPFNISAGKSLLEYPIIHAALHFLSLNKKTISQVSLSYLLTSPFLGNAESERLSRAHFDILLREKNINMVDVATLLKEATDTNALSLYKYCPKIAKRLNRFFALINSQEKTMSYTKWASLFNKCLSLLGWPGERSLNSEEYQIVENWLRFLSDFMTLDALKTNPTFYQALQKLSKLAAKQTFQPESPPANIQILGILEAAALPFDFLWVAGMDDLNWPPKANPNPFIPKQLQRELQMPHATALRELLYCRLMTKQFKESANLIIFSYAEKNSDIILNKSPLIDDLDELTFNDLSLADFNPKALKIYQSKLTEFILDEKAPPILPQEKIDGGADLIKQQALCPFKAFATYRLKAKELETPALGLRAKDRGIIIHHLLELIWKKIKNHETLCSMDENELNLIIRESISHAITTYLKADQRHRYIALEKKRLESLIYEWLKIEKQRDSFKVITQETTVEMNLNELKLTLRIDRIDEICNGQKIIIDYKTGKNNVISRWFGNRPDEPQLPLYALIDSENKVLPHQINFSECQRGTSRPGCREAPRAGCPFPSDIRKSLFDGAVAIAFAQVAAFDHCFKGISRFDINIKGIKTLKSIHEVSELTWDELINQWKTILTQLANDFYQGIATVDPKESQTCLRCHLKPLCRIGESQTC